MCIDRTLRREDSEDFQVDVGISGDLGLCGLFPLVAEGFEVSFDAHNRVVNSQGFPCKCLQLVILDDGQPLVHGHQGLGM